MTRPRPAETKPATEGAFASLIPWTAPEVALLKATVARGANLNDAEFALFGHVCQHLGLDPMKREIYAVRYEGDNSPVTFQTAIDGFRKIARRTGKFGGYAGPAMWCGEDGEWVDVWTDDSKPPVAARVGVRHVAYPDPIYAVARYTEYVATRRANAEELSNGLPDRVPNSQWTKRPAHMLAKCAEALAIRMAFPDETGGLYTDDEMEHVQRVNRETGEIIDSTATDVTDAPPANEPPPAPEPPELFGVNQVTIDDLFQTARDGLQKVGGNVAAMKQLPGWPAQAKSLKGGLAEWARPHAAEDVIAVLKAEMEKAFAPQPEQAPTETAQQPLMQ